MNTYTIKEMREKFDIPSSTLRYYEEIGLFPKVMRTETNQRIYTDELLTASMRSTVSNGQGCQWQKCMIFLNMQRICPAI